MYREERIFTNGKYFDFSVKRNVTTASENPTYTWHSHEETEIIYVINGCVFIHLPDNVFKLEAGDIFVTPPNIPHHTFKAVVSSYAVIIANASALTSNDDLNMKQFFQLEYQIHSDFNSLLKSNKRYYDMVKNILGQLICENFSPDIGCDFYMSSLIRQLLVIYYRIICTHYPRVEINDRHLQTFNQILSYIDQNISSKIRLEDLCRTHAISYSYLSKLFTSTVGISFSTYLIQKRIQLAKNLLLSTDLTVFEIANKCGFSNENDIYKKFKKFEGTTPLQFRKSASNQQLTP